VEKLAIVDGEYAGLFCEWVQDLPDGMVSVLITDPLHPAKLIECKVSDLRRIHGNQ